MRRNHLLRNAGIASLSLLAFACLGGEKREGLSKVDELLTRVEQVQIESVVAREKASAAFDAYGLIVAPDFQGDAMAAFNDLVAKVEGSKAQAKKFEQAIEPMNSLADRVFRAWTADLEQFGNTNLRQASQGRLAETRARYSAVHDAAIAALVSMRAFDSDLEDQALFLQHDFNSASITVIAAEVPALTNQARDLGRRLNQCAAASKAYIAAGALRGEYEAPSGQPAVEVAAEHPAPARKLPNPMAEEEGADAGQDPAPTIAPAHKRPRPTGGGVQGAPAPVDPNAQPNTQPTSNPDNKPAPSPTGGGGR